jgi:hypothetical protein
MVTLHKHQQYKAYDYVTGLRVPVKLTFIHHTVTAHMWASVPNVMSFQYKYQSHHLLNPATRIQ